MKRILLIAVISLAIGGMVYAQQGTTTQSTTQGGAATTTTAQPAAQSTTAAQGTQATPNASQTKQSAQQLLDQTNDNSAQYDATLAGFRTQNTGNTDAATYNRLQHELTTIESNIASQEQVIKTSLDKGTTVNEQVFSQLQQLLDQHKAKAKELQNFVQSIPN